MKLKRTIRVKSCQNCPFRWDNMEYPETLCQAAVGSGNFWCMCFYSRGDPAPPQCPLRVADIKVVLEE